MQPYFRDAVQSDLHAIAAILRGPTPSPDDTPPGVPSMSLTGYRDALAEIDSTHGNYVLVAEFDNQIVAMTQLLAFRQLHDRGARVAQITTLNVAGPFRTSGIGNMLLDHAARRAMELGCRRLQVLSSTAATNEHPFWERSGFIQLDRGYVRSLA
jgi:N-acetylglutamate synthase-like GNAT family acetyltransferase